MSAFSPRSRRVRGFTLVELIITVSIVAVLAAVASPAMSTIMTKHRVQDATSDLFAALLKARGEALMLNADVNVAPIGGDWAAGWRVPDPTSAGKFFDVHEPVDAVAIRMSGAPSITYQYNGRIRGGVGVKFSLTASAAGFTTAACVSVDPSGRPYTQEGPCAGGRPGSRMRSAVRAWSRCS